MELLIQFKLIQISKLTKNQILGNNTFSLSIIFNYLCIHSSHEDEDFA